ncbi:hypothetical protein CMQ_2713 [Grosmannia clavigera kw1407]|uniref:BZIP domain-containing protein n=1 Tax=Grosmannia clavigera (strain kw1407 / UAMH 11150) TaxID=655863 RepID=F0XI00_GROCL|nr:uncharacterized protein CMQ_2713 [Grosmannia clavigera kw1407]EFX02784.1 hypothetical protein CMQ_2713 [Grosmannia clavigera kw1407]
MFCGWLDQATGTPTRRAGKPPGAKRFRQVPGPTAAAVHAHSANSAKVAKIAKVVRKGAGRGVARRYCRHGSPPQLAKSVRATAGCWSARIRLTDRPYRIPLCPCVLEALRVFAMPPDQMVMRTRILLSISSAAAHFSGRGSISALQRLALTDALERRDGWGERGERSPIADDRQACRLTCAVPRHSRLCSDSSDPEQSRACLYDVLLSIWPNRMRSRPLPFVATGRGQHRHPDAVVAWPGVIKGLWVCGRGGRSRSDGAQELKREAGTFSFRTGVALSSLPEARLCQSRPPGRPTVTGITQRIVPAAAMAWGLGRLDGPNRLSDSRASPHDQREGSALQPHRLAGLVPASSDVGEREDEANLARIRDNQRRSRARRKEYQQELEQRVRTYEEQGIEASTEVQQAARHVSEENRRLRTLLHHHGVPNSEIEAYLLSGKVSALGTTHPAAAGIPPPGSSAEGPRVQALEQVLVPRKPLHFGTTSPGTSSPAGEGREASVPPLSSSSSSSTFVAAARTGGSSSVGSGRQSYQSPGTDQGKNTVAALPQQTAAVATSTEGDYTSSYRGDFLSTGPYSLAPGRAATPSTAGMAFYGLDGASTEDLQYSGSPAFFDYSVSPPYLGPSTYDQQHQQQQHQQQHLPHPHPHHQQQPQHRRGGDHEGGMGATSAPQAHPFYSGVQDAATGETYMRSCPACMSGLGCQVHGTYYGAIGGE